MASVLLGLLAAAVFGAGVALQHRAAAAQPDELSLRVGLLVRLARDPWWLLGLVCDVLGFLLEVAALRVGPLVVVQPIIMTAVVFALLLNWAWGGKALTAGEWLSIGVAASGLCVFLVAVAPTHAGDADVGLQSWMAAGIVVGVAMAAAGLAGVQTTGARRAALLGVAAGLAAGAMAVLGKAFGSALDGGLWSTMRSWEPYALIVAGALAVLLQQSAYQAGHAKVSLPIIEVVDPLAAVLLGVLLFGEHLRVGGGRGVFAVLSVTMTVGALAYLCRSPAVAGEVEATEEAIRRTTA